jgi:hypothetical protein
VAGLPPLQTGWASHLLLHQLLLLPASLLLPALLLLTVQQRHCLHLPGSVPGTLSLL